MNQANKLGIGAAKMPSELSQNNPRIVRTHRSAEQLPREKQLAWDFAILAHEAPYPSVAVLEMVQNRIIDNAAVAVASLGRSSVVAARDQALSHPPSSGGRGALVMGLPGDTRVSPEWATWANGVAVRELDFHDTFLAADYSHPGDNIPALIAVAQHLNLPGKDLARAIAVAYEVQVSLVRGICLHEHKIDHVAHLGPSVAAGLGSLLRLEPRTIYDAIGQALHLTTATRQSRKGEISSWKAFAPAFAGKIALEAVDRAMRGEGSPSPAWEGEDGVIAWLLGGKDVEYRLQLASPGADCEAILDTYTKEHSAEYQAQALIDLAINMSAASPEVTDPEKVDSITIHTSHHTHFVIGSGSGDPEKYNPGASRETLDHSIPYIFSVALQDRSWHHIDSYLPDRAKRPDTVALWKKIETQEDKEWTRRYHSNDRREKAFGARVEVVLTDGRKVVDELAVANAHPLGASPFSGSDYDQKFRSLATETVKHEERERFLRVTRRLRELSGSEVDELTVASGISAQPTTRGIF